VKDLVCTDLVPLEQTSSHIKPIRCGYLSLAPAKVEVALLCVLTVACAVNEPIAICMLKNDVVSGTIREFSPFFTRFCRRRLDYVYGPRLIFASLLAIALILDILHS
jgi:hypothetical protein